MDHHAEPITFGPGTNTGHGHLWERPDGVKARCGGPYLCHECRGLIPEYGTTQPDPKQLCTVDDIIDAMSKVKASLSVRVLFCNPAECDNITRALEDEGWGSDEIIVHASRLVDYGNAYVAPGPDPYKAASMSWEGRIPVI